MDVRWETPPEKTAGRGTRPKELEFAWILKQNPDQWARFRDFEGDDQKRSPSFAKSIRGGQRASFRADSIDHGEFDAVSRKLPGTNITAVYVRWATLNND